MFELAHIHTQTYRHQQRTFMIPCVHSYSQFIEHHPETSTTRTTTAVDLPNSTNENVPKHSFDEFNRATESILAYYLTLNWLSFITNDSIRMELLQWHKYVINCRSLRWELPIDLFVFIFRIEIAFILFALVHCV